MIDELFRTLSSTSGVYFTCKAHQFALTPFQALGCHRTASGDHSGQRSSGFTKPGTGTHPDRTGGSTSAGTSRTEAVAERKSLVCPRGGGTLRRHPGWLRRASVAGCWALGLREVSGAAGGGDPCLGPEGGGAPQVLGGEDVAGPGVVLPGFAPQPRCLLAYDLGHVTPLVAPSLSLVTRQVGVIEPA